MSGFEQNDYVPFYNADHRTPSSIIEEYQAVRSATIALFKNIDTAAMQRMGTASNFSVSVRALAFIIAGHELHHLNIARERYLV